MRACVTVKRRGHEQHSKTRSPHPYPFVVPHVVERPTCACVCVCARARALPPPTIRRDGRLGGASRARAIAGTVMPNQLSVSFHGSRVRIFSSSGALAGVRAEPARPPARRGRPGEYAERRACGRVHSCTGRRYRRRRSRSERAPISDERERMSASRQRGRAGSLQHRPLQHRSLQHRPLQHRPLQHINCSDTHGPNIKRGGASRARASAAARLPVRRMPRSRACALSPRSARKNALCESRVCARVRVCVCVRACVCACVCVRARVCVRPAA